jgi:single-strand DNA-binding protein
VAGSLLKKGSKIFIERNLEARKWQGKDGVDKYTTEILDKKCAVFRWTEQI